MIVVDTDLANVMQAERRAEAAQVRARRAMINSRLLPLRALPSMASSLASIRALALFRPGFRALRLDSVGLLPWRNSDVHL